jgi:hypothetical protein
LVVQQQQAAAVVAAAALLKQVKIAVQLQVAMAAQVTT